MSKFVDGLRGGPDRSKFYIGLEMTEALSRVAQRRRLQQHEVVEGVITALVSLIQSITPITELQRAAELVCDVIMRRLTVTGDSGEDHHPRRMV